MNDTCDVSDLPAGQCAHCRLAGPIDVHETDSWIFSARYEGTCGGCGFDIKPGEPVQYVALTNGSTLTHARCHQ